MDYIDRINPISKAITTYLDELLNKDYQIPTFQRNVVWQEDNVKNYGIVFTNFILLEVY